jgi:WD40 repeat protein
MDTVRFLRSYWALIQKNPFDVYYYVGFTPLSSIFRQTYSHSLSFPYRTAVMGSESDWPSELVIQPHNIETQCLSPCGNWLATGGSSNKRAIFGIWDISTADGTIHIHPCEALSCSTYFIAFYQRKDTIELRTRCKCEKLCEWDAGTDPITLLQKVQLKCEGSLKWWADDYSKAISEEIEPWNHKVLLTAFIDGNQQYQHDLGWVDHGYSWRFSPGTGRKVIGWSKHAIEVFESSSGRRCFKKSIPLGKKGYFDHVCFSPDAKFILYSLINLQSASSDTSAAVFLSSSEDDTQLWWQYIEPVLHVDFFSDGGTILVRTDKSVHTINLFDGCIKKSSTISPRNISIHSINDRIIAMTPEGVEVLEPSTLNRIQWYPWSSPVDKHSVYISWRHSTVIKIGSPNLANQSITFLNLLSSKPPRIDALSETKSTVSSIFLSPDGSHLLSKDENGQIQLWCTSSGTRVNLTGDDVGRAGSNFNIEFTSDSSTIVIWRRNASKVILVEIKDRRAKAINLPGSQIMVTTLCPRSKRIIAIDQEYQVILLFLDDVTSHSLGKLPMTMTRISNISLSPATRSIALIGEKGFSIFISVLDYEMDPVHPHLHCSGTFFVRVEDVGDVKAEFTLNGAQILVIERTRNIGFWVSLIKLSSRPLQKLLISNFYGEPSRGVLSLKPATIGHLPFFRATLKSSRGSSAMNTCFDCMDGRMLSYPIHRKEDDRIYYGNYQLPIEHFSTDRPHHISERHVAYINTNQKLVVVNYSGYIDQM